MPISFSHSAEYHEHVAYSRRTMSGRMLDWTNQPSVYKIYRQSPQIPLSWPRQLPQHGYFSCLNQAHRGTSLDAQLDEETLGIVLASSGGISETRPAQGGEIHLRVSPSAGALYPCELYIAVRDVKGLEPGLYHYFVAQHTLSKLRDGVFSAQAMGGDWSLEGVGALVFVSTIFFRSGWKYDKRCYRYLNLDCGHIVEALGVAADGLGLGMKQEWIFDDDAVNRFLGVDRTREACFSVIPLKAQAKRHAHEETSASVEQSLMGLSKSALLDETPEAVWAIHALTCAAADNQKAPCACRSEVADFARLEWRALPTLEQDPIPEKRLYETVMMRRSRRNFVSRVMDENVFVRVLSGFKPALSLSHEEDVLSHIRIGIAVQSIDAWENGIYWLNALRDQIALSTPGEYAHGIAAACLDQMWLANSSLLVAFFLREKEIDANLGPRGYRASMMACAAFAHRLYLGATALELGVCGIGAFYDDEVIEQYQVGAELKPAYVVGVGPIKR